MPAIGMRLVLLPAAALALAIGVVLAAGRMVEPPAETRIALELPDPDDLTVAPDQDVAAAAPQAVESPDTAPQAVPVEPGKPAEQPAAAVAVADPNRGEPPASPLAHTVPPAGVADAATAPLAVQPDHPMAASRLVAPAVVAPPAVESEELQREAPREPLSQLSLALPPVPPKVEWSGKPLFRPVAVESAVFESGGHRIALDGVRSVPPDESCSYEGADWQCGVRARAAFRMWLRGRALVCDEPHEVDGIARAHCSLAKNDAAAWLVSNGWALAAPDGPYVEAEEQARQARRGIFGAPPDAASVAAVPDVPPAAAIDSIPILGDDGVDDGTNDGQGSEPPADPRMQFPPPPAP